MYNRSKNVLSEPLLGRKYRDWSFHRIPLRYRMRSKQILQTSKDLHSVALNKPTDVSQIFRKSSIWYCPAPPQKETTCQAQYPNRPHYRNLILTVRHVRTQIGWFWKATISPKWEDAVVLCDRPLERPEGDTWKLPVSLWAGTDHRDGLMSVSVSTIISLIWPLNHTTGWLPTAWEPSAPGLHIALWDYGNYLLHPCHLTPTPTAFLPVKLICSMCLGLCCRCLWLVWKRADVTSQAINSLQFYCNILNIIAPVNHRSMFLGWFLWHPSQGCTCRISPGEPWEEPHKASCVFCNTLSAIV